MKFNGGHVSFWVSTHQKVEDWDTRQRISVSETLYWAGSLNLETVNTNNKNVHWVLR